MKLKLGLYNKDLAVRFCIALSTVTKIVKTWINLIYIRLGSIRLFPSRDIIIRNMTQDFKEQYPTTTGLQIYGGPGSLSHDFKIWPITFKGSGPSGPILFSCEKISL